MTEYWTGGSGDDYKNYTDSDNFLADGHGGNDFIWGSIGNDTLLGWDGNDTLKGWSGNDYLFGGDDDDYLYGETDHDVLYGGSGADNLDGGSGNDSMYGGADSDIYYVDSSGDLVKEYFNEGDADFVISSVSYTLGDNLELLALDGGAINGTGNSLNNIILTHVQGNVDNYLSGGYGNDTLAGYSGNDTLVGGGDSDGLIGGQGADTFVFDSPSQGIDLIIDWEAGDVIQISGVAFGVTSGSEILYYQDTGALTTPGGTQFATLQNQPLISDVTIVVI